MQVKIEYVKPYNLFTDERLKLKELVVFPGSGELLSSVMVWFVTKENVFVNTVKPRST